MAQITTTTSTDFIGTPMIFTIKAAKITKTNTDDVISFQRLCVDITANSTVIHMATAVADEETISFDVSSALRSVLDETSYSPSNFTQPEISYKVEAYDEYSLNGETKTTTKATSTGHKAYAGKPSDMERLKNSGLSAVTIVCSRKPTSSPEIAYVGETIVYVNGNGQTSTTKTLTNADLGQSNIGKTLTLGGKSFYILNSTPPADRYQLRFINGLGALESIAVTSLRETEVNISSNEYVIKATETFNSFQRGITRKSNDYETWKLTSGPIDRQWQSWFIHELLMAEHVWIYVNTTWVRCHIIPEDTVKGYNANEKNFLEVQFSVKMDINGSLI